MISFSVNKQRVNLDVDPATPLLWVLRDNLSLTGISIIVQFICTFAVWIFAERIGLSPSSRTFLWINILFLLCVGIVPFSTALVGKYPNEQIAVVIYGVNLIVIGLVMELYWWYATPSMPSSGSQY